MGWLSKKLGELLLSAVSEQRKIRSTAQPGVIASNDVADGSADQMQFAVIKCANGRVIKVSEYKPTKGLHTDWHHEVYIVKDDEKVTDVIARIMAIKALEQ